MYYSLTSVTGGSPSEDTLRRERFLGAILPLAVRSRWVGMQPLAAAITRFRMPLRLRQYRLFYNDIGQCVGYVIWAMLHDEVVERVLATGDIAIRDFEWNEGPNVWVIDAVFSRGVARNALEALRIGEFAGFDSVCYLRPRRGGKVLIKEMTVRRKLA